MADSRLLYFACGSTSHQLALLFRRQPRELRAFPSGVFLYDDGAGRRVLFDTGYAATPWRAGLSGLIYRVLVPPKITAARTAASQLLAAGIDPDSIAHVVLSHLHPDHIGGLRDFPRARVVVSEETVSLLTHRRVLDGVLPALLPSPFPPEDSRIITREEFAPVPVGLPPVAVQAVDLFGDGAFLIVDLPGHQYGHLGAIVEGRVVLAGDAAWAHDLTGGDARLRSIPRHINHDMDAYAQTEGLLDSLARSGLTVMYSHDIGTPDEVLL